MPFADAVTHPRAAYGNRADAGHDLTLGQMPVAPHSLAAISSQLVGMVAEEARNLGLAPNSARAPWRKISVNRSVNVAGWESLITLSWVTAYHSFSGEVEASNTPTIRRLTPSSRHQLPRIAHRSEKRNPTFRTAFGRSK